MNIREALGVIISEIISVREKNLKCHRFLILRARNYTC